MLLTTSLPGVRRTMPIRLAMNGGRIFHSADRCAHAVAPDGRNAENVAGPAASGRDDCHREPTTR